MLTENYIYCKQGSTFNGYKSYKRYFCNVLNMTSKNNLKFWMIHVSLLKNKD